VQRARGLREGVAGCAVPATAGRSDEGRLRGRSVDVLDPMRGLSSFQIPWRCSLGARPVYALIDALRHSGGTFGANPDLRAARGGWLARSHLRQRRHAHGSSRVGRSRTTGG
jgi:hypothetical protein